MSNLIEEENVNAVNLSLELERAVISHVLQDDHGIYVNEDGFFNFWIRILDERKLIGLTTHTLFKKSASTFQRLDFCNKINSDYFNITAFTTNDDKLKLDYSYGYRDGIFQETFIRSCRQFPRTIETAMRNLDPDNEIVLRPGDTETEPEDAQNE